MFSLHHANIRIFEKKKNLGNFTESSLFTSSLVSIISYRYTHFHFFIIDFDHKLKKNQSFGKMQALKLPKLKFKTLTINHSIRKGQ